MPCPSTAPPHRPRRPLAPAQRCASGRGARGAGLVGVAEPRVEPPEVHPGPQRNAHGARRAQDQRALDQLPCALPREKGRDVSS